jgi:transposase-like protein
MSGYKRFPKDLKDQILERVKSGVPVSQLSQEHAISIKTIYTWIAKTEVQAPGVLQLAKLKRRSFKTCWRINFKVEKRGKK